MLCLIAAGWIAGFSAGCKSAPKPDITSIYGPAGRQAKSDADRARASLDLEPIEGTEDFQKARALYDAKNYADARKAFRKVAKKYKDKPIEEDSLFMVGECYFEMERYPQAQDAYSELFKKYTSTRYTDQATRRLFKIAQLWLEFPKPTSDIELAQYSEADPTDPGARNLNRDEPVPHTYPLIPNLFDKKRPAFDTQGRAVQALTTIWLNDSTGPLADDALIMAANHHLRKHDFQEADRYYKLVRENYPQSEFVQASYVIGAYAKLMTYQGARYDGRTLKDAQDLTSSTLRMFPDLPQREKLVEKLAKIKQQSAEREWERVQYHMRRREKASAAIYCQLCIESDPESPYAQKARELLPKLASKEMKTVAAPEPPPSNVPREIFPEGGDSPEGKPAGKEAAPDRDSGGEDASGARPAAGVRQAPGKAHVSDTPGAE